MTDQSEDTPAITILKNNLDQANRRREEANGSIKELEGEIARWKETLENVDRVMESLKMSIRDLQELRAPTNTAQESK